MTLQNTILQSFIVNAPKYYQMFEISAQQFPFGKSAPEMKKKVCLRMSTKYLTEMDTILEETPDISLKTLE